MITTTPKTITKDIKEFCNRIVKGQPPIYLDINPDSEAEPLDCFINVKRKIDKEGGDVQYGWIIWEIPTIMVEAEFHAVWISPEKKLIDITPCSREMDNKTIDIRRILFLIDPSIRYEGKQVNNIRQPLRDDCLIKEYITIADKFFEETNKGDSAYNHGLIELPPEVIIPLMKRKLEIQSKLGIGKVGRNDPCGCGSGLKYKKCCKRN